MVYLSTDSHPSQCSTVVRNTVVRATIKVNGKPQILGTRSSLTLESIDLKFGSYNYVGDATPHAKKFTNWLNRAGAAKG